MQSFIDIYKIAYHYIKCNFTMFPADSIWPNATVSLVHTQLRLIIWSTLYKQCLKAQMMLQFWVRKYKISPAGTDSTL